MDKNKLVLPITILIASIILGGFYYASEINKQKSIERQQQIELQAKIEADKLKMLLENKKVQDEKEKQDEMKQALENAYKLQAIIIKLTLNHIVFQRGEELTVYL